MEKDEIADIVKKVIEAKENASKENNLKDTPVEVKTDSKTEYENQRIEELIDRKIDERLAIEKENERNEHNDITGKREASWSMILGIVSIILSTSLVLGIISGIYAIILSRKAKKRLGSSGQATAGKVLGIVGLSLIGVIYFWVIVAFLAEEVFY